ncbi:biopolymer transporter ExbB [Paracoccus shandongensis]|uniref:biopolymer transporter ExbB n=1 Tax=Paracoccus shandongensis TaxID=2816048 RepID=UPI003AF723B2
MTATRAPGPGPAHPRFSQPIRQIVLMVTVLALVLAGGWIAYGRILPIFRANLWLNGMILAVFALGVLACFWQVGQLIRSVSWIERFAARRSNAVEKGIAARGGLDTSDQPPRLLAPLAALLGTRGAAGGVISTGAAASILDSVATRIDEGRDITRYLSNLLIFLGLLGTFYGLATTIPAVVETIRSLAPQQGESGIQVFDKLMSGLESQLGGMATAFSSSLLGLAGSLVVGLLELFATHGQNRFYRELEEWMSGFTRVSLAGSEGDAVDQAALAGFLEQMASQMDRLHQMQAERDDAAAMADERVVVMAQAIEALVHRSEAEQEASLSRIAGLTEALSRLADGQERLVGGQDRLVDLVRAETERPTAPPPDLGGIEAALNRLTGDLTEGREEMVAELRSDLLVLTRAVRAARFNDPFRDDLLRDPLMSRDGG